MQRLGDDLMNLRFESLVNSVRCKTFIAKTNYTVWFESLVNSVRCKTPTDLVESCMKFESLVNSVRCKTEIVGREE